MNRPLRLMRPIIQNNSHHTLHRISAFLLSLSHNQEQRNKNEAPRTNPPPIPTPEINPSRIQPRRRSSERSSHPALEYACPPFADCATVPDMEAATNVPDAYQPSILACIASTCRCKSLIASRANDGFNKFGAAIFDGCYDVEK